jgi:hypothetical protein
MTEARVNQLSVEILRGGSEEPSGGGGEVPTASLSSCRIEANLSAGWTDISADCIGGIDAQWGISGTTPNDRLADTGTMTFTLLNNSGAYTPGSTTATAGWHKGTEIKLFMVYDGETYIKFRGVVDSIDLQVDTVYVMKAVVTVVDWMNYAAEHPIITPSIRTTKTADEALGLIIDTMPKKPVDTLFDTGVSTFPSVFDIARGNSTAMTEMAKITDSELGYIYLRKEKNTGEQLVFENAHHRSGLLAWSTVQRGRSLCGFLLQETGDKLLQETADKIILNETVTGYFSDSDYLKLGIDHGQNIANHIVVTAYPRKVDTSLVVLYSLGSPMEIGSGETKTFSGNYSDPVGGQNAGGFNMQNPVATTDYTLNTLEDGSGTDITSNANVSVTFGGNNASITVKNTSASSGYITFFQLRGYGVYTYASAEFTADDGSSINTYGYFERHFNQKYQADLSNGAVAAKTSLYYDRIPRTMLQSIYYLATKNVDSMAAFLAYDIGSLLYISEAELEMTGAYIIQNISFTVDSLGIIWCAYGLVEYRSYQAESLNPLTMQFNGPGNLEAINYGYLPHVVQTSARSYSLCIYRDTDGVSGGILSAPFADGGGVFIYISVQNRVQVYSNLFNTTPGIWHTATDTIMAGSWIHVAVTLDAWDIAADPVIYINHASVAVTESSTPTGALNSEFGAEVVIGNYHTNTQNYGMPFNGKIKDVRIFNRIITHTEVDQLWATMGGGVLDNSVGTNGITFWGPCVTEKEESTDWHVVTTSEFDKFLENMYGAVGQSIAPILAPPPLP